MASGKHSSDEKVRRKKREEKEEEINNICQDIYDHIHEAPDTNIEEFDGDDDSSKKEILIIGILILLIFGVFFGGKFAYGKISANRKTENANSKIAEADKNEIPEKVNNYKVLGQIKIDKLNFSQYILDPSVSNSTTNTGVSNKTTNSVENVTTNKTTKNIDNALNYGLVKLYGEQLNKIGNFTIIGHNAEKSFSVLEGLNKDEIITVKERNGIQYNYKITDIYTIEPTDLKPLMSNKEYKELTLITCSTGSNKRLVVKAIEENDYQKMKKNQAANLTNTTVDQ